MVYLEWASICRPILLPLSPLILISFLSFYFSFASKVNIFQKEPQYVGPEKRCKKGNYDQFSESVEIKTDVRIETNYKT